MIEGWIRVHRALLDSEIFASEKGLKIWIWMLLKANYKDRFVPVKIGAGQSTVEIKRGELLFGRFTAEDELGINGSTIYKWIKKMEVSKMIELKSNSHYTVVSINKYNEYNTLEFNEVAATEQPTNNQRTTKEQPKNTPNKEKKVKKEKNIYIPEFSEFKKYALENDSDIDIKSLELKYKAWTENDWKDGNNKKITNWKSKILNTIPYIKINNDVKKRKSMP